MSRHYRHDLPLSSRDLAFAWFISFSLLSSGLNAQDKPMEYGKISESELQMKSFETDSGAAAVVLCDYGEVYFSEEAYFNMERHTRIKILSENGYDWGTVTISYLKKSENKWQVQRIDDLVGQTFYLDLNGKMECVKLEKKSIFEEDIDGKWFRKKFTFPALRPGCIIEYRYILESADPSDLSGWSFQRSIPTRWSEFRARVPQVWEYVTVSQGFNKFLIQEKKFYSGQAILLNHVYVTKMARQFNVQEVIYMNGFNYRWVMKDVPALREEPYVTTMEDYRDKVEFQLSAVTVPGEPPIPVLENWDKLVEELWDSKHFGKQIQEYSELEDKALEVIQPTTTPLEKIKAIHAYIANTINWNGIYEVMADEDLDDVLKSQTGNSADINLMLISMLRDADISAWPVIISTRSHGKIQELYPLTRQFNHVLALVDDGTQSYLMDATEPLRPYNLLPLEALNDIGLRLDEESGSWINVPDTTRSIHSFTMYGTLGSDGSFTGMVKCTNSNYDGVTSRKKLKKNGLEQFIKKDLLSNLSELFLDSAVVMNEQEFEKPLQVKAYFKSDYVAQVSADLIYLTPIIADKLKENPFKLPDRTYPVDFGYPRQVDYKLTLTLPDSFTITEIPANLHYVLPNNTAQYARVIQISSNILTMRCKMEINKSFFKVDEYSGLREFYNKIVSSHADIVVLKKKI